MAVLMGNSSKARLDLSPPLKTDWLATGAGRAARPTATSPGSTCKRRRQAARSTAYASAFLSNEQNDCTSPDSYVGIGTELINAQVVGNRSLDGTPSNPRHGAVLVRSNDLTDATVGTRASCAAHQAAGFVVDGFYLIDGVRTFCDQP